MKLDISDCPEVSMTRGAISRLRGATHTRLRCVSGSLWITVDGDLQDIVLSPGESWVVPGPARVVVQAMLPSTIRFEQAAGCLPTAVERPWGLRAPGLPALA